MPIGWVGESVGRGVRPAREPAVLSWSQRARTAAMQVVAHVTGMDAPTRDLVPTIWTRWETAFAERVCPVCASYAGHAWPGGEGPQPPLHPRCRCRRRFAFITWSVRG